MQKDIVIQSTVNVVNYLEMPIEIGFYLNNSDNQIEKSIILKSGQRKYIELKYFRNNSILRFVPYNKDKNTNNLNQNEKIYKKYQLEDLIYNNKSIDEFENIKEQHDISEFYQD